MSSKGPNFGESSDKKVEDEVEKGSDTEKDDSYLVQAGDNPGLMLNLQAT